MAISAGQQLELPKHVAIIMDGNRRWANKQNLNTEAGHKAGYERFKEIVDYAFSIGVQYITVYAFSTENFKRTPIEVNAIMALARFAAGNEISKYSGRNIRVRILGRKQDLPQDLQKSICKIEQDTRECTGGNLNIAFAYGGRAEIIDAAKATLAAGGEITEDNIANNLYTTGQIDPELIIRTGGAPRLSNFLMWQSAYSEIYITDVLWPDFDKTELDKAIEFYKNIKRNFGK